MAFFNRVGTVLKQTVSKHTNTSLFASSPSLYQAIRCMSSKLFVGGISYSTDEMSLKEAFSQHGEVIEARIIMDRESGRSRGFGFVTYTSSEEASNAIQAMDGQDLHGRRIRVNHATDRPRTGSFGGGGYGGGGYGGGSYGGGGSGYSDGGMGAYGGGNSYTRPDGGYDGARGGGRGSFGGEEVGNAGNFNDRSFDGENTAGYGGNIKMGGGSPGTSSVEEQFGGNADDTDGGNEDFSPDSKDGNFRDDNDEPDDYANTRGMK